MRPLRDVLLTNMAVLDVTLARLEIYKETYGPINSCVRNPVGEIIHIATRRTELEKFSITTVKTVEEMLCL